MNKQINEAIYKRARLAITFLLPSAVLSIAHWSKLFLAAYTQK